MQRCFFILVLFCGPLSAQNDSLVGRYLVLCKDIADVERLIDIMGEEVLDNERFDHVPTINPLNPKRLKCFSSSFGMRFHPMDKENKPHLGLDISAKAGTPIHAAASGTVQRTKKSNYGYGNQVVIEHRYGFRTRYAHMYLFVVEKGQTINKGDIIGYVGNTGKSTGHHIHYEVWKNGTPLDPYPFCFLED
ncbi:MAG: M23 family metallopeptidase [Bacteroidota bacterium]